MSDPAEQAVYIIGPHIDKVSVIAISTSVAGVDLSATTELGTAVNSGKFVTLQATGADAYYFLNSSAAGTPDPVATSGSGRCMCIPNGQSVSFIPRSGFTFLRVITASGTGQLRSYVSSKPSAQSAET